MLRCNVNFHCHCSLLVDVSLGLDRTYSITDCFPVSQLTLLQTLTLRISQQKRRRKKKILKSILACVYSLLSIASGLFLYSILSNFHNEIIYVGWYRRCASFLSAWCC